MVPEGFNGLIDKIFMLKTKFSVQISNIVSKLKDFWHTHVPYEVCLPYVILEFGYQNFGTEKVVRKYYAKTIIIGNYTFGQ